MPPALSFIRRKLVRIGIIGAGMIGSTLAKLWVAAGHEVLVASRHPEELQGLIAGLGPHASAGTAADAAAFGRVVMLTVPPQGGSRPVPRSRASPAGKSFSTRAMRMSVETATSRSGVGASGGFCRMGCGEISWCAVGEGVQFRLLQDARERSASHWRSRWHSTLRQRCPVRNANIGGSRS